MIDLPTKAAVYCTDGLAGRSTYVIANPINDKVTHLVIKSIRPPFHEYLVPVNELLGTTPNQIRLKCTREELEKMKPFEVEEYVLTRYTTYLSPPIDPSVKAFEEDVMAYEKVKRQNIPGGEKEFAVWRGVRVEATDGYVGQVVELLMNTNNRKVTHLVLRERHIFRQKGITIPVSQIDHMDENTIYLKLDRQSVEALPTTPIQRWQL